jgi:hypothetical protein
MSPDAWLKSQKEEKKPNALSPDEWLKTQKEESVALSPDEWLKKQSKTEIPPEVDAGFSVGDTLRALGSGVVGAGKSLTDVFGADNFASEALGGVQKSIQAGYSPERAAEMARRQAIEKQASESDSITQEISAFLGGVAEAPLQSLAQGLGSIIPYVGTGVVGAIAKLGRPALLALNTVVGAAQGAGTIKGSIYDNVKDELIKSGMGEAEAKAKAKEAQNYLGENFLDIAVGAGLGAAAARYGVEPLIGKKIAGETAEEIAKQGFVRRVSEAAIKEAPMEGVQAGQEQLASNLALQRQGFDVGTFSGVAGAAARDAVIGGMTAGTIGALPSRTAPAAPTGATREEMKEIIREDTKANGQELTEEQLDAATDNAMKIIKEAADERAKNESSGLDTGDSQQGVPGAGEPGVVSGIAEGTAASTASDVGGDRTTADTTDVGKGKEPSTLEEPAEILAARSLISSVDQGGLALNTRKVNTIARDLGLEVKKGDKPLDTIARIREALGRVDSQPATGTPAAAPTVERREQASRGRSGTYYEYVAKDATGKEIGVYPTKKAAQEATDLATLSQEEFFAKYPNLKAKETPAVTETTETAEPTAEETIAERIDKNSTEYTELNNRYYDLEQQGILEGDKYKYQDERDVLKEKLEANLAEGDALTAEFDAQAKAPEAVAPSVTEETDTGVLSDYYNGLVDAMNRTPINKSIASPAVIESLKANGIITEDGNGRLTMTPKGSNMAVDINNAIKFGSEAMTPEQQTELFAKYIPELGGIKVKEDTVAAARQRSKKKGANSKAQEDNTSPKKDSLNSNDQLFATAHPSVVEGVKNNDVQATLRGIRDTGGKFLSALATRLLGLNLTTRLTFDEHYDLVLEEAEKVKNQKDRILQWMRAVYPVVYMQYFNVGDSTSPYIDLAEAFNALEQGAITTADGKPLRVESIREDIADVARVYRDGMRSLASPATFFINQNTATFRSEDGTSNYTVMHEIAHAATHWAINNRDLLDAKQQKALDNLTDLFNYAKLHTKDPGAYGYTNLHEFVAEAFSNPAFQMELRAMKRVMDSDMSAWSKFIQTVAKLFGVENVLFHTLANADVLFSANVDSTVSGQPSELWAPDRLSVRAGRFVLNTAERSGSKIWDTFNNLIKGRVKWKDLDKKNFTKFLSSTNAQTRKYLLGALTLDQLTDIVGDQMPQFKLYVKEVDAMLNTRNQILAEGDPIIKVWSNLLESNPQKAEQLGKVMIEATLKRLDPDSQGTGHDATKFNADPELKAAWLEMITGKDGDVALQVYRQVRAFYERRMNEYTKIQLERVAERERLKGTPDAEIQKLVKEKSDEINKEIIRPYFPIKRFGEYWLQVGTGQKKIFMQFEDAYARDAELDKFKDKLAKSYVSKYKAAGDTDEVAQEKALKDAEDNLDAGQGFSESLSGRLADIQHLNRIYDLIDKTSQDISLSVDPLVKANEVEALRARLRDEFGQLYLELMPSESIQKMFMHRGNIAGPSQDMLRAFSVSRQRVAYQRARFQHMPQLFNIVKAANDYLDPKTGLELDERTRLRDYVKELELNLRTAILEPPKQSGFTTFATNFGFIQFLSAPASAFINAMAIPGIYAPVAAAKYGGVSNVTTTLSRYARMLGGTKYVSDETGRYEFLSLSRAKLETRNTVGTDADSKALPQGKTLADVYNEGVARGIINVTQSHEAANLGETPSNEVTGRWNKIMYYVSLPFHSAEKFNREMAYMSTFDMGYRKALDAGLTPDKAYERALQEARDVTQKTMFNYNSTNKPRYFRGDLRNVLLQFKLYPQHMSVFMFRTFQQAIGQGMEAELARHERSLATATPDEKAKSMEKKRAELDEMKKEARDAFLGLMGMTFITAGFTGMPLFFIFSGIASAFHAVFGDDDEPFDPENWFKNWTNRTFGGFIGDSISRGFASQATGLNFADRMNTNLTDMWFPDVRKSNDEVSYLQNMFINLLGPTAGAAINYGEALKRFNDGHTERALEVMMPAAIKNLMVGTRYMVEGRAVTLKGNEVDADIPAASALAQMLGFSPEDTAQKQKASIEMKNVNEKIIGRRTDLLNAFFMSVDTGDSDMLERVLEKIVTFNATNPMVGIDPNSLFKSVNKRYQDRALANITGGISINKNLMPQLQGMLDYSQD